MALKSLHRQTRDTGSAKEQSRVDELGEAPHPGPGRIVGQHPKRFLHDDCSGFSRTGGDAKDLRGRLSGPRAPHLNANGTNAALGVRRTQHW